MVFKVVEKAVTVLVTVDVGDTRTVMVYRGVTVLVRVVNLVDTVVIVGVAAVNVFRAAVMVWVDDVWTMEVLRQITCVGKLACRLSL